nr:hypothetical protein CPGR_00654 [Mycolicibacterium fortuitum subsp. fortuitum DSM 46621 = ATCC 6841 = JCM 6387]
MVAVREQRVAGPDTGDGGVLVATWRLQTRIRVGDLLGQRHRGVRQVLPERQVVELDRVEDRRQVLRAQFGRVLVAQPATRLDRAADELQRVGEVGQTRQNRQAHDAALVGRDDVEHVRGQVRVGVQTLLQAGARLRLQDRRRRLRQVVHVVGEHAAVLVEELTGRLEDLVEILQGRRQLLIGVGERVGELRQVVVERHELLIALV